MNDVTLRLAGAGDLASVHSLIEELGYVGIEPEAFARGYAAVLADTMKTRGASCIAPANCGEESGPCCVSGKCQVGGQCPF